MLIVKILIYLLYLLKVLFLSNKDNLVIMCGILPIKIYDNLTNYKNFKPDLHKVGGVYGIVNISARSTKRVKQYIGSSKNLYNRLLDHLNGRDSNSRLPPTELLLTEGSRVSIAKYGIENFKIYIYYFHLEPDIVLTDVETKVIKSFSFYTLYNFKK